MEDGVTKERPGVLMPGGEIRAADQRLESERKDFLALRVDYAGPANERTDRKVAEIQLCIEKIRQMGMWAAGAENWGDSAEEISDRHGQLRAASGLLRNVSAIGSHFKNEDEGDRSYVQDSIRQLPGMEQALGWNQGQNEDSFAAAAVYVADESGLDELSERVQLITHDIHHEIQASHLRLHYFLGAVDGETGLPPAGQTRELLQNMQTVRQTTAQAGECIGEWLKYIAGERVTGTIPVEELKMLLAVKLSKTGLGLENQVQVMRGEEDTRVVEVSAYQVVFAAIDAVRNSDKFLQNRRAAWLEEMEERMSRGDMRIRPLKLGTTVSFDSVSCVTPGEEEFLRGRTGEFLRIRFEDTGTGFDARILENGFIPGQTISPPGVPEGNGVGMAGHQKRLREIGGDVRASNVVERDGLGNPTVTGARVDMYIPYLGSE